MPSPLISSSPACSQRQLSPSSATRINKQPDVNAGRTEDIFYTQRPKTSQIRFQGSQITGFMTNYGYKLTPEQLKTAQHREKGYYYDPDYGVAEVQKSFNSASEKHIKAFLDKISKQLAKNPLSPGEERVFTHEKCGAVKVDLWNSMGMKALVYTLTSPSDNKTYKLKLFRPSTAGTDISFEEVVNGAFLTVQNTRDAARLLLANTSNKDFPWTLTEFIPEGATLDTRSGKTMQEKNITISDDGPKNRVGPILIDHGGHLEVHDEFKLDDKTFNDSVLNYIKKRLF